MSVLCPECKQGKPQNCTGMGLNADDEFEFCATAQQGPVATYAGTTGHSGTNTSQERAEREVADGSAEDRARRVLSFVNSRWYQGATVKELRDRFPEWHHGKVSSTLTNLHRAGRLVRLAQTRDRCKVYVYPSWEDGRPTEQPRERAQSYPYPSGDVTVLGPEVFIDATRTVICYKGQNYYLGEFSTEQPTDKEQQ